MSLDGHDKLSGYQKSTFPLHIYGGMDTFSGRMHFLRVWTTNNDPNVIGRFYYEYLSESKGICAFFSAYLIVGAITFVAKDIVMKIGYEISTLFQKTL